jgi:hypothetical protein
MKDAPAHQLEPQTRATHAGLPPSGTREIRLHTLNHSQFHAHTCASTKLMVTTGVESRWCVLLEDQSWRIQSCLASALRKRTRPSPFPHTRSGFGLSIDIDKEFRAKTERTNPTLVAFSQQVARFRRRNDGDEVGKSIKRSHRCRFGRLLYPFPLQIERTKPTPPFWQSVRKDRRGAEPKIESGRQDDALGQHANGRKYMH